MALLSAEDTWIVVSDVFNDNLSRYHVVLDVKPITVYMDNEGAFLRSSNLVTSTLSSHVETSHHIIKDNMTKHFANLEELSTGLKTAVFLVKV